MRLLFVFLMVMGMGAGVIADDVNQRRLQAGLPTTTEPQFRRLMRDPDWEVRQKVARNRKTPADILDSMANDTHPQVRIGVATNLATREKTFMTLARDQDTAVRSVVARFEFVPASVLALMATDPSINIRFEVASNLNTDKETLLQLSKDSIPDVAAAAAARLAGEEKASD